MNKQRTAQNPSDFDKIAVPACQYFLYQEINSRITINVRFEDDDVWLTQLQIAALFHTSRVNVVQHIRNIYKRSELQQERTCKDFLLVRKEGTRTVNRNVAHYSMDMIIAVGYRVNSPLALQFRQWVAQRRKQIVVEKTKREKSVIVTKK